MVDNSFISSFSPQKKFISKLLLLFFIVVLLDRSIGSILEKGYFNLTSGFNCELNQELKVNSDIRILGSSRGKWHYVPQIISEQTGLSCYNDGRNGQFLLYTYAFTHLIFTKKKPKIIVLDLHPLLIVESKDINEYNRLKVLLPYNDDLVVQFIKEEDPFISLKLCSKIFPYNSKILEIVRGNIFSKGEVDPNLGYLPSNRKIAPILEKIKSGEMQDPTIQFEQKISEEKVEIFKQYLESVKASGVKMVCAISPYWKTDGIGWSDATLSSIKELEKITDSFNIPTIEITQTTYPLFKNPELFGDTVHLNHDGAVIFSEILAEKLEKVIYTGSEDN